MHCSLRSFVGRFVVVMLALGVAFLGPYSDVSAGMPSSVAGPRMSMACGYGVAERFNQVRHPGVREASALVASQQWPGIYWTLNDSKNTPTLYAFDERGEPRGTFRVGNAANVDWEALQVGPDGDGGYALYIGDAGDNQHLRREAMIYRVPEPEPLPLGVGTQELVTAPATAFRFVFPGISGNIEAMIVHPVTAEVLLIGREVNGLNLFFQLPVPLETQTTMTAYLLDVLDARTLDPSSAQVTDASISSDGQLIVLRTYASALIYEMSSGQGLARLLSQEPRVYPLQDGPKGEGITFHAATLDLISIGEGTMPFLYRMPRAC